MGENAAHFIGNSLFRPVRMLAVKESGFMPATSPVKTIRRAPALLRRHAPEYGELFGTRLLICKHD
jgi:hypothetical protein